MAQLFFKSNAEGAEVVKVECSDFKLEFDQDAQAALISCFDELWDSMFSIPIKFHGSWRSVAAMFGRLEQYDRLRRQHKAKGRGKNWRIVR